MKTKKIISLLLCVLLIVSLAPLALAGEGERVQISYAFWGAADESAAVQEIVDTFNASQDRIEVVVEAMPWETFEAELNTRMVGGTMPDTSFLQEGLVISWAKDGVLMDVSGMYGEGESKPLDSLAFKYDGQTVAYAASNEILLMYYNKDMFDAAGVAYPPTNPEEAWTWDEFVEIAKKLTLDVNGLTPNDEGFDPDNIVQYGCMVENLTWQLELWALSNGGGFYSPDGSEVWIGKPESVEAIQKVADLHLVDHVAPLSAGMTDDGVSRSLIAGTVAMTTNGQWNIGTCLGAAKEEGLNYGVAVLPFMKDKLTLNTSGAAVVYNSTKHPEEAMEWLKWFTQEENSWWLIESGIWMPVLEKWYTDEEYTRKWVSGPNHPPYEDYKEAVVDYGMAYAQPASWFYVNNTAAFNSLLTAALGEIWTGAKTAEQAIGEYLDALIAASKGE